MTIYMTIYHNLPEYDLRSWGTLFQASITAFQIMDKLIKRCIMGKKQKQKVTKKIGLSNIFQKASRRGMYKKFSQNISF